MYYFNLNDQITNEIKTIASKMKSFDIPISQNIKFKECSGFGTVGWCKKINGGYVVAINKNIVFKKDLQETIIHELIHTIDGCLNHNKKWRSYASLCSYKFGVEIKVGGFVYMLSNPNYKEPNIEICHIKPEKQCDYLNGLLQTNPQYLLSNINQICCYLSQSNRDYLFLTLRESMPDIWFGVNNIRHHSLNNHQLLANIPSGCLPTTSDNVNIAYCLDSYASSEAKHILASNYLRGVYDSLILNYEKWVCFSRVLSLTKDYVNCQNRYNQITNNVPIIKS